VYLASNSGVVECFAPKLSSAPKLSYRSPVETLPSDVPVRSPFCAVTRERDRADAGQQAADEILKKARNVF
jgi:hypothetical protein